MALNFPADPVANPSYEAPNGVTYIWNDSIQSWVVKSVNYDGDYVNRVGDTMSGNLNFATANSPIGINWGGNPRLKFKSGGEAELNGNFLVTGQFKFSSEGIRFEHDDTRLRWKNSTRIRFIDDRTAFAFEGTQMLSIQSEGVLYHGNFGHGKNVVTVEYVTSEIETLEGQIEEINDTLEDTIIGIVESKAVLLEGNQVANGNKTFSGLTRIKSVKGNNTGSATTYPLRLTDSNGNRFFWVSEDGKVHVQTRETFNNGLFANITSDTQVVNKKYTDSNYLKTVSGTSGDSDDTGVRTNSKSNGSQKIYMEKATISQYGVSVRGLLPQGSNNPANADLKVGQMYYNTTSKRVLIRVS